MNDEWNHRRLLKHLAASSAALVLPRGMVAAPAMLEGAPADREIQIVSQEGKQGKDVCESEPARHRGTPHKVDGKTTPTSAYVNRAIVCSKLGPTKGRSLPSAARSAVFPDQFFGCAKFPQTFELTRDCEWAKVCGEVLSGQQF
jgi:hypothetical protein